MRYDILPIRTALLWVLLSTVLVSGSAAFAIWAYKWYMQQLSTDKKYLITELIQESNGPYSLPRGYLAELLELSSDLPTFLSAYNLKAAQQKLLGCMHIETASLKKVQPNAICISYTMRTPIGFLPEYSNSLVDADGYMIAFQPFFPPLDLPEIVLGDLLLATAWGSRLSSSALTGALAILESFQQANIPDNIKIRRIDVSKINAPSAGQREAVLILEKSHNSQTQTHFVRLGTDYYSQSLLHYGALQKHLDAEGGFSCPRLIIDLRVPQLAFLSAVL